VRQPIVGISKLGEVRSVTKRENTKRWRILLVAASLGVALMSSARASMLTYEVSGTFTDGGTFSGTFGYDPTTNSYSGGSPGLGDQFAISTSSGSQGQGVVYAPFRGPLYYSDESSSTTQFYIFGGFSGPNGGEQSTLTLDWQIPLNGSGAGSLQPITGGSEEFTVATLSSSCAPAAYCVTTLDNRQVASGFIQLVQPVPLPAAAWLLLSALGVLGAAPYRRRKAVASIQAHA
jgi:hypothetical protein